MSQSNREQQIEIYNQLQKELGDKSNIRKREAAGDLLYGLVDVLEGADVQSLRKSSPDGKSIPWTAAEKVLQKNSECMDKSKKRSSNGSNKCTKT